MPGYPMERVRVLAVLCADDDGGNNAAQMIAPHALDTMFKEASKYYEDSGIRFHFNPHVDIVKENRSLLNQDFTIPRTANLNQATSPMTEAQIEASKLVHKQARDDYARQRSGRLVVYFRHGTNLAYDKTKKVWTAGPSSGAFSWGDNEFVAMGSNGEALLFAHEAGHYFHLWHTHSGNTELTRAERDQYPDPQNNSGDLAGRRMLITKKVQKVIQDYVAAGNDWQHGHFALDVDASIIRDTPPDPSHEFFIYYGHQSDGRAVTIDVPIGSTRRRYTLFPDKNNIMSYFFREPGEKHFSAQQMDRVRRALEGTYATAEYLSRSHLISRPIPAQPFEILATGKVGTGWTHIVPFSYLSGAPFLIWYSQNSAQVHFDRLNSDGRGLTIVKQGSWAKWTHVESFALGGDRYLLVYNMHSGDVRFDKLHAGGNGSENVWSSKWGAGWTHVVPLGINSYNRDHLLVYNAQTGIVRIDRFNSQGAGTTNIWQGNWSAGWSHIMPYRVSGTSWRFLIYNKASGAVHFDHLDKPETGSVTLFKHTWAPGWTHFMPYPTGHFDGWPAARFIAYNATSGTVHFDVVSDDGFKLVQQSTWGTGWTHLVPTFMTGVDDGSEGFIVYNQKTGECHFDRLL